MATVDVYYQSIGRHAAQVDWLGLRFGSHLTCSLPNEWGEPSKWQYCVDFDSIMGDHLAVNHKTVLSAMWVGT